MCISNFQLVILIENVLHANRDTVKTVCGLASWCGAGDGRRAGLADSSVFSGSASSPPLEQKNGATESTELILMLAFVVCETRLSIKMT